MADVVEVKGSSLELEHANDENLEKRILWKKLKNSTVVAAQRTSQTIGALQKGEY